MFCFIIFKAINVPITHDEVSTALFYTKFSPWKIMMFPDPSPNNHILNTLLTKGSMFLFGNDQFAVRLPSILSFIVFGIGVYRTLKHTVSTNSLLFFPLACLFIANPYFIDFFALSRGYGLSSALATLSVSFLLSGFKKDLLIQVWLGVFFALLASYANFTLLPFWAAVTLVVGLYFLTDRKNSRKWKQIITLITASISYLALIATPIYKMQSTDQFDFWTSNGFFEETILKLIDLSVTGTRVYYHPEWVAWIIVAMLLFSLVVTSILLVRNKLSHSTIKEPFVIASLVLLGTIGINLLQVKLLGTPNLSGRTALFFYPLFVVLLASMRSLAKFNKGSVVKGVIALSIFFVSIQHFSTTAVGDSVLEWKYDRHTLEVINYIDEHRNGQNIYLDTYWLFTPSFYFYTATDKFPWLSIAPYHEDIDVESDAPYYYIKSWDYPHLKERFDIAINYEDIYLMVNKEFDPVSVN
jgi:hypothetical protein